MAAGSRAAQKAHVHLPSCTQICASILLSWDLMLFFCLSLTEKKRKATEERKRQGKKNISSAKESLTNLGVLIPRQRTHFNSLPSHSKGSHSLTPFSLA